MPRSAVLALLALLAWLMGATAAHAQRRTLPQRSVLIVVLDDVAADDLALYGGPVVMPTLEGLAAGGVTFANALACANCAPSRRALLTGHWWLSDNGADCTGPSVLTPTLAELFLPESMPGHASALVGKWHLGGSPISGNGWGCAPVDQGFDFAVAYHSGNVLACTGTSYEDWTESTLCAVSQSSTYEPIAVRDALLAGWAAVPFPRLAVVSANLAHQPFHVPPASLLPTGYPVPTSARKKFEAMCRAYDTLLAQMLVAVDLAHTLVLVVGDNGTPPLAAPFGLEQRCKGTTYQRGIRVPLIAAGAGVSSGGRVANDLVHIADLWRTSIELGGGAAQSGGPYPLRSVSLAPVLANVAHAPLHDFVLVGCSWGTPNGDRAAVSETRKLRQLDDDGDGLVDREEFYDLALDEDELVNRIASPGYALEIAAMRAWITAEAPF